MIHAIYPFFVTSVNLQALKIKLWVLGNAPLYVDKSLKLRGMWVRFLRSPPKFAPVLLLQPSYMVVLIKLDILICHAIRDIVIP